MERSLESRALLALWAGAHGSDQPVAAVHKSDSAAARPAGRSLERRIFRDVLRHEIRPRYRPTIPGARLPQASLLQRVRFGPLHELVEDDKVLLDVGKNNAGTIEVCIGAIAGRIFELAVLEQLLAEGRARAERD
jgi:hypothetical protein